MGRRRSKRYQRTVSRFLSGGVWSLAFLCWGGGAVLTASQARDVPDDGLLEFLGSVDTEDRGWNDYLARTDIDTIARRAGNQASHPGGGSAPARAKPDDPPADPPASPPPPAAKAVGAPP